MHTWSCSQIGLLGTFPPWQHRHHLNKTNIASAWLAGVWTGLGRIGVSRKKNCRGATIGGPSSSAEVLVAVTHGDHPMGLTGETLVTKRRKPDEFHGYGCPTCGENVGFNAKRCKSCGQSVAYSGGSHTVEEVLRRDDDNPTRSAADAAAAAAAAFLALRRPKELAEPLATRAQLTPFETARPVEICSHLSALRCEQLQRTLRQLVQRLMLHPLNQNWFNAPVDAVALGLPDYHELIRSPMDLGTIKSRLATLEYADVETFAADVRLVFQNATRYNPQGNAVHQAAVAMLSDFEADLDKATERAKKQQQRTDEHECGLCQGKQCPLCGDKCLTFETPALLCSGPCAQRVRPGQNYHVTRDGSRLWCHKCYLGLKSVIPPPPELLGAAIPGAFDERGAPFGTAVPAATGASQQVGLWYKRDLVKRRFDEDVKEPWVQCDACARWVHQTCALFNPKTEADAGGGDASRFVCPLCELQQFAEAATTLSASEHASETASSSDDDSSLLVKREGDDDASAGADNASASKAVTEDEVPARTTSTRPLRIASLGPDSIVLHEDGAERYSTPRPTAWAKPARDPAIKVRRIGTPHAAYEFKLAIGDSREDTSWHFAAATVSSSCSDVDDASGSGHQRIPSRGLAGGSKSSSSSKKWWSARALPRTEMTDHLESAVKRRMRAMSDPHAIAMAETICVRLLSAVPQSLRVPGVLRRNFVNPDGTKLPEVLPFESRAVALFQRTDGVDVSLFSMYVHEFGDAGSEGPSAKRVYIAYVDSVEYFVPRLARTPVYHELLVAYLDWSRRRGFEAAHIWACPPQRGNNFIYWSHPSHQRTPSRERLAEWYKAMIRRALEVKAVARVDTLYDAYFRCLDEQRRRSPHSGTSTSHRKGKGGRPKGLVRRASSVSSLGSAAPDQECEKPPKSPGLPPLELPKATMEHLAFFSTTLNDYDEAVSAYSPMKRTSSLVEEDDDATSAASPTTTGTGGKPLPICPPCFDGDYFPEEACRLYQAIERRKGLFGNGRAPGNAYSSALRSAGEATVASQLEQLLKHVTSQPSAYPFLRPVDPVLLNLPDYNNIITQPMDLGTVEHKLVDGAYETPQYLVDDVRLCFRNAQRYNPPAHPVHEAASHLSLSFEKKLQSLLTRLKTRLDTTDARDILNIFPLADSETCQDPATTLAAAKAAARAKAAGQAAAAQASPPAQAMVTADAPPAGPPSTVEATIAEALASTAEAHPVTRKSSSGSRESCDDVIKRRKISHDQHVAMQLTSPRLTRRRRQRNDQIEEPAAPTPAAIVTIASQPDVEQQRDVPSQTPVVAPSTSSDPRRGGDELPLCPRLPVELATSMHRMKDNLFVLYLQPDASASKSYDSGAVASAGAPVAMAPQMAVKPGRKRRIPLAPTVEEINPELTASDATFYRTPRLSHESSSIVDPDAGWVLSNPLLDSRHTWLEMCQFWKMQFDSLRRAKHSSTLLLYHLHNPRAESLRVACSHCARDVRRVRWMCQTCVDYCICRDCARVVAAIHPHLLTPYRITFMRRRTLTTSG